MFIKSGYNSTLLPSKMIKAVAVSGKVGREQPSHKKLINQSLCLTHLLLLSRVQFRAGQSPITGVNCMLVKRSPMFERSLKQDYQFYTDVDRHPSTTAG